MRFLACLFGFHDWFPYYDMNAELIGLACTGCWRTR